MKKLNKKFLGAIFTSISLKSNLTFASSGNPGMLRRAVNSVSNTVTSLFTSTPPPGNNVQANPVQAPAPAQANPAPALAITPINPNLVNVLQASAQANPAPAPAPAFAPAFAPAVVPAPAPAFAPAFNKAIELEKKKKQMKQLESYYRAIINNLLKSFDSLSNFVSTNSISNVFSDKPSSGSIMRLTNGFNSYEDFKAYSSNFDYGYRLNLKDSLVITPILGFEYTRDKMNGLNLNIYDLKFGVYSLYKFEKGFFSDFMSTYSLSFNSNASNNFEPYRKTKAMHGFNINAGLIGWNHFIIRSELLGDISLNLKLSFRYNKMHLNANSVIENDWESVEKIYEKAGKLDFDIIYLNPEFKLGFDDMFKGYKISKIINFTSINLSFKQNIGSKINSSKYVNGEMFNNEFLTRFETGLKTKFGLWYGLSFETTNTKYFAVNLNVGFSF